jgi:hypothetical protein
MEIMTKPRNFKFLVAHRILIIVSALCFLALLSAAPLVLSRVSTVEATSSTARSSGSSAAPVDAQTQPSTAPSHKLPKPPAGKRKADHNM